VELWKSDGTTAGTVLVKDIQPGSSPYGFPFSSTPSDSTAVGKELFFSGNDGISGRGLWKTDSTTTGTVLVKDIRPGSSYGYAYGSNPQHLTAVDDRLFFAANDGVNGTELWKSDGTTKGTVLVADIRPGNSGSYPYSLTAVDGTLFFT